MTMKSKSVDVVILAAGMGTRMKSAKPKVLHELLGKPMIAYLLDAVDDLCAGLPVVVVGSGAQEVMDALDGRARFVVQDPQLGTAHAVKCAHDLLQGQSETVIVANSDFPLISAQTYQKLVDTHLESSACLTVSTVVADNPRGFGRILRDDAGGIMGIVEDKDATQEQKNIRELNSNPYCFNASWLWEALDRVEKSPVGEYYLTDLVKIAYHDGAGIASIEIEDPDESIGINNRLHLAEALKALQRRINQAWMLAGVTMIDPDRVYIEESVSIGRDTLLYPEVYLHAGTTVGEGCRIGPSVMMTDTFVGDRCRIIYSMLESARLENDVDMGPFGHLRRGAHLDDHVHMGNFGEIKNARLGQGVRMGHFSYIGDAEIGAHTNIGAGTVTCNYDGEGKFKTEIGEGVFLGSDTMLVAPVKIGNGAKTGAGAVVTHDVPPNTLVVGVPAKPLKKPAKGKKKTGENKP